MFFTVMSTEPVLMNRVHARHVDVRRDHVGTQGCNGLDRLLTILVDEELKKHLPAEFMGFAVGVPESTESAARPHLVEIMTVSAFLLKHVLERKYSPHDKWLGTESAKCSRSTDRAGLPRRLYADSWATSVAMRAQSHRFRGR
jgi:hypothetical protein